MLLQTVITTINDYRITPLSDRSVLLDFGNTIDECINKKVMALHKTLLQKGFEGFIESVPAYASLAVFYDVQKIKKHSGLPAVVFVEQYLRQLMQQRNLLNDTIPEIIKIPVCYDAGFGFDMEYVAEVHQLSIPEVISLHTSVIYRVYMIGFMPGFAYMGTVEEKLITPRKDKPRLQVPAGSVGIAGAQTGIYPVDSPGGWQIIGKTPLQLFDTANLSPCLLSAGDRVQFFSIDKKEFDNSDAH